jgi:hypothetical protein
MSYREENGQVVLTMSRQDFERLLLCLGGAVGAACLIDPWVLSINEVFELINRINEGNPNYTPYSIPVEQKSVH